MSAFTPLITLQNLTFRLPGGRVLFDGLTQSFEGTRIGLIGHNGVGKTSLFELIAKKRVPTSGSITASGTVAYMPQNPDGDTDALIVDLFGVKAQWALLTKASEGQASADEMADVDWELEGKICAALSKVGLEGVSASQSVAKLSGGQRTRAAFAAVLFQQPDILLLDEPTNNLDRAGRAFVIDFLTRFSGLSLTISHDRELLEQMEKICELSEQGLRIYGGNWSFYRDQKAVETEAAERSLKSARTSLDQIKRKTQTAIERKQKKDAAGRRQNKQGVNAKVLMNAQAERAENSSGTGSKLASDREASATERVESAAAKMARLAALKIDLPPTGLASQKQILKLEDATIGYTDAAPIASGLALSLTGPERLAVVGANGSGKSTLLKTISGQLPLISGQMNVIDRCTYLDQSISCLDKEKSLLDNFLSMNPQSKPNDAYSALARFKFRNEAAEKLVKTLSGGEVLRAGLACVLCSPTPPQLLILDEPTNHLDLTSLETIEAALINYDGALIVVSHDQKFLDALNITHTVDLTTSAQ